MLALLVHRRTGRRIQPRVRRPPAARILREPSITRAKRSITGRPGPVYVRGLGLTAMCVLARSAQNHFRWKIRRRSSPKLAGSW
jgi:hypothetical protein